MNREIVLGKLEELLSAYTDNSAIDQSSDIMAKPLLLSDCDSAAFFLDVEREFTVSLNILVPDLSIYSINSIADKLFELC
jgi:hypothetical protein